MKDDNTPTVAYFCMEYGLESSFKIYAGGLGILAGDYLKAAEEMNKPVVGVGILWKQGYTRQLIGEDGQPYDSYPVYKYNFLEDTGVTVKVKIRKRDISCKVWRVTNYGNNPLYLLDTDLEENSDSWITGQLYGWFEEERIAQEMILGIGGIRALRKLGIDPDIYHFNEGHAVFAGLELIREGMEEGLSFESAREEVREKIVFTTHTPVIQGNEEHPHRLLQYMGVSHDFTLEQMAAIGGIPFNMTVAGLRLSYISNGVSSLHSNTANEMWKDIDNRSEIIAVTNGVHHSTWVSPEIINNYRNGNNLWQEHRRHKNTLINYVENKTGQRLNQDSLLIGFARRAAPYKRGTFIFREEEKIADLLHSGKIQIIFSGKAHPLDDEGKAIVARQAALARKYPESVVFIEDYDMETAFYLTQGCDLWLNTPRRPKEACGTSGIKAAMNGVLNLSILDGWWAQACEHGQNGWQFGNGKGEDNFKGNHAQKIKEQDANDLKSLYDVLLNEVIPTYYEKHDKWVKMMQDSINSTYERFSAERMLSEYYQKMYEIKKYFIIE
ncbi:MAG: alpha-glucan family phosphorylase [Halanaerobiaceae bacterium]